MMQSMGRFLAKANLGERLVGSLLSQHAATLRCNAAQWSGHAADSLPPAATADTCSQLLSSSFRRAFATESRSMLGGNAGPSTQILGPAAEAQLQKIKGKFDQGAQGEAARPTSILRTAWRFAVRSILVGSAVSAVGALYYGQYELKELDAMVDVVRRKQDAADAAAEAATIHFHKPVTTAAADGAAPSQPPPSQQQDQSEGLLQETTLAERAESLLSAVWLRAMDTYLAARRKAVNQIREFSDPTYHKLLPDLQPELRGRIKTLVLDLDELLVYKEWTRQKGWLIYKRPGAQDFLRELGQYFEIVVYTSEPNTWADPVINKLDPNRLVQYRLYRPETQYHNGKHVRDLSKLNREMGEVLFLSANPDAWEFQPENTIKLKPWKNQTDDTMLLDLIPFLQLIATKGVRDVRDVVRAYDGVDDIPRAFRERMKQLSEQHKVAPVKRGFLSWQK